MKSYGYKGIAKIFGVKTPKIDEICALFESKLDYSENGAPQQYGITTRADFVALYTHFLDPWAKR